METIELTARNLDEARRTAAERLGVDAALVELTVLEETKGLFGKSSLRVRATAPAAPAPAAVKEPAPKAAPRAGRGSAKVPAAEPVKTVEPDPEPVVAEAEPEEAPKRGRRPARKSAAPVEAEGADAPETESEAPAEEIVATAEEAAKLAEMVREVLRLADLEVVVNEDFVLNGRYVNLVLDGKDVAYLVGKHGEVLNAFQYLMNVMARQQMERDVRVTLDGNHYRERREEALTKLAVAIAEQVRERGEEAVLDALPAFERRVVHHALQELEGISTYSEGEEPNRRVVIAPSE